MVGPFLLEHGSVDQQHLEQTRYPRQQFAAELPIVRRARIQNQKAAVAT